MSFQVLVSIWHLGGGLSQHCFCRFAFSVTATLDAYTKRTTVPVRLENFALRQHIGSVHQCRSHVRDAIELWRQIRLRNTR